MIHLEHERAGRAAAGDPARVVDDEIAELLSELDIEPGEPIGGEAVSAIQGWATIQDDDEVVEALRLDAADEMVALLAGTHLSSGCDEEDEEEDSGGDQNMGRERRAPPAYGELSSHFGALEAAAEESGKTETRRTTWREQGWR